MTPEPKRPLKVFLCHASADKPAVRNLYQRLVSEGVDAWLDAESLVAGQNWQIEIPKAIRESDVVIVCLSEKSINKEGYVQREIKFALDVADEKPEGTIFVIPARLEECKVPDRLSMYHWVELFERDGYERLMRALRLRADKIDATLQIKNNWLPNIASSPKKSNEIKKPPVQEAKLATSKPKGNSQIAYWIGGFAVLVLGIIFLSSLNNPPSTPQPTPENTQTQAIAALVQDNVEPSETTTPKLASTPVSTLTPTPLVTNQPVSVTVLGFNVTYDFVASMCLATWTSDAELPCPGADGNGDGFVFKLTKPELEDVFVGENPGIITVPQNKYNGYIEGVYPAYVVKSGDRFRTSVGCANGAESCYVVFRLDYIIEGHSPQTHWAWVEKYNNQFYEADVDLSSLVGREVKFKLVVLTTGSPIDDRAIWVSPMIVNPQK